MMNSSREMSTMSTMRPTIIDSGECSFAETIKSAGQCEVIAKKYMIDYTGPPNTIENTTKRWPAGCFLKGGKGGELIYNTQRYPSVTECSTSAPCICMPEMKEVIQRFSGKCNKKGLAEDDCKPAAINLGLSFTGMSNKSQFKPHWPAGCFLYGEGGQKKLYYNPNSGSKAKCDSRKGLSCLCFKDKKPLDVADPPPNIAGAYTEECETCSSQGQVAREQCSAYATALQLTFHGHDPHTMNDPTYPQGCFLIKKTLWYNTAVTSVKCDQHDTTCICGGGKEAYQKHSSTCEDADRLTTCECKKMADSLQLTYSSREYMTDPHYPAGCFMVGKKLWFNSDKSSAASCEEDKPCICAHAR